MTRVMAHLLGRIPVGWLQLVHNPARLAAAVAGVVFANVLVFMQLGILGSLNQSIIRSYELLNADIMISAADTTTLTEGSNIPRQRLFQALADPGVASGVPLYLGTATWQTAEGDTSFQVFAIEPNNRGFLSADIAAKVAPLRVADTAIVDYRTRGLDSALAAGIRPATPLRIEISGQTITLLETFDGGVGFATDGYMVTSDQTFLRLFPARSAGAPDHILLKVWPGENAAAVADRLRRNLGTETMRIRTVEEAAQEDQAYQTTERPTGLIFGFGVLIGVLVGIVIVYQVLSTDVADHMSEYATFKAMGYGQGFFLSVVFEEAIVLATLGFIPGLLISILLYSVLNSATGLPLELDAATAVIVLFGTVAACVISGAIATRKLNRADPADLF